MDLATFRATSKPVKRAATYRLLTDDELARFLKGENIGSNVAHGRYLRMCVIGAENVTDDLYLIEA